MRKDEVTNIADVENKEHISGDKKISKEKKVSWQPFVRELVRGVFTIIVPIIAPVTNNTTLLHYLSSPMNINILLELLRMLTVALPKHCTHQDSSTTSSQPVNDEALSILEDNLVDCTQVTDGIPFTFQDNLVDRIQTTESIEGCNIFFMDSIRELIIHLDNNNDNDNLIHITDINTNIKSHRHIVIECILPASTVDNPDNYIKITSNTNNKIILSKLKKQGYYVIKIEVEFR